jgi:phytoene synthase
MTAQTDAEHCTGLLKVGSKSFALAGLLVPKALRPAVTALYAFCRVADDAIDDSPHPLDAYLHLVARLDRVVATAQHAQDEPILALTDPVDRALARMMRQHLMPRAPIDALLEGFLWDAQGRRYLTFDDTLAYGARVAGSVGVCMAWLMGQRQAAVLARAADLGVAMQLTNIARDIGDDARMHRVYVPDTWLADVGLTADQLQHRAANADRANPEVYAITQRLLSEADKLYARGRCGLPFLPGPCRPAMDAAARIYQAIGGVILKQKPQGTLHHRAVVPLWRKLGQMLLALCNPWARRGNGAETQAPPLAQTAFLLTPLIACPPAQARLA